MYIENKFSLSLSLSLSLNMCIELDHPQAVGAVFLYRVLL